MNSVVDINVNSYELLPTPRSIKEELPLADNLSQRVESYRNQFQDILDGKDHRLIAVVGPCSIHDTEAGLEYARKLKTIADKIADKVFVVMRVYFTKPRTTTGWKGLINDPLLNDSFEINAGLKIARKFLIDITELGLATATEALDSIIPQYIDDLICWNAIGARTTESQTHREMASGLSTPVGFKNGTDGNTQVAINAIQSAYSPHHFLGIDQEGRCAVLRTKGNHYAHIVLRGGQEPNYDPISVKRAVSELTKNKIPGKVMIDCSHGNSNKNHKLQGSVFKNCLEQIVRGETGIFGLMLESNLHEGKQDPSASPLKYGVSITDACIDFEETEELLLHAHKIL